MSRACLILSWVVAAQVAAPAAVPAADKFDPFAGPKPLAVFLQTNPWANVIGADTPRCVVYDGGEIVFVKDRKYLRHQLTDAELAELKQHIAALAAVKKLESFYNLQPGVTDQPELKFYLATGEKPLTVSVYGLIDTDEIQSPATIPAGEQPKPDVLPKELVQLHKYFDALDFEESRPWEPKLVELILWPYDYAPDASIVWPRDWPGLTSDRAVKRGDSYSLFLDYALLPKLVEFLGKRQSRGAVEIDGKKWAASARYTFPSEPVWREAFGGH